MRPGEAITGLKTPTNLVPLDQTVAPIHYEGAEKHNPGCPCEACIPYLKPEEMEAPELIQTLYESGYALPTIIELIAKRDTRLLRHKDLVPPRPARIRGLGRPETTRKEAWWERAITWLLSRGES